MAFTRSQLGVVVILSLCVTAFAQQHKLDDARRSQLESAVAKFMTESSVPGISVAVVEDGEYVWSEGFGMADLENFVPATPQTLYRLASISKSLTATGAMQLWERGKLDLDAPVQQYCPAFPQKPSPITTREVMAHLGEIRHYKSESQDDPETETPNTSTIPSPPASASSRMIRLLRRLEPNLVIRPKASRSSAA